MVTRSKTLREFVGDLTRSLISVQQAIETAFGKMYRIGAPSTLYEIDGKSLAIYTVGADAAIGLAFAPGDDLVDTIYWWDNFDFGSPDYELAVPQGVDFETLVPTIKASIASRKMGEIPV